MVNTRRKVTTGRPEKISQANGVARNSKVGGQTSLSVNARELNGDGQFEDGYEEMPGGEESEETKVDNDDGDLNAYCDDEAELEQDTYEDDEITDQVDDMWEDYEESSYEEDDEEYAADEDAVNNEDAIKENGGVDEVNDDGAIKENKKIGDGGEAKEKEHGGEAKAGKDGGEAKPKEEAMEKDGKKAKGHDSGKVDAGLKNDKNSNKNIKKKDIVVGPKKADSKDKPESSQKRKGKGKGKKRVESMGMVFICSSKTKSDCFKYMVLGLPESKKDMVEKIYSGMRLFLYDVDLKLMYGIFRAAGPGGYNIEPKAFKSQFPSQVRFSVLDDCLPIAEEKFKGVIKENYYSKSKFDCKLKEEQVKKLCKLFIRRKNQPKKLRGALKRHIAENPKPLAPETSRRLRVTDRKRPALEEPRFHERPHKHTRKLSPPRRPYPVPVPSYAYEKTSNRRDQYSYRDRREFSPVTRDPYRELRDLDPPPVIRRDPYLESAYLPEPYSRNLPDTYSRNFPEPYTVSYADRGPDVVNRSAYGDGRGLYLEHPAYSVAYGGGYTREPPLLDSRDGYNENRGVEYGGSFRREEVLDRGGVHPMSLETRYRQDAGGRDDYRQLGLYADPIYSAEYGSRVGLAREYRI